jgi:hypothetical protein
MENMQIYNSKVSLLKERGTLKPQFEIQEVMEAIDKEIGSERGAHRVLDQKLKQFQSGANKLLMSSDKFENLKKKK